MTTFKEILAKVTKIIDDPATRKRILDKASVALAALVAVYPPEGPWNKNPGSRGDGRWYQRGFGSRWMRKGGRIGGGTPYFSGIGGRETSERLQRSWQIAQEDFTASVFTNVSYAPFLFDPDRRVSWAGEHGWKDLNEFESEFAPVFEDITLAEVDNQINQL